MKRDSTLFYFLDHYGDLKQTRFEGPDGLSVYETDTCMIVRAFLKGLLCFALVVALSCLALYPIAGSIAEGIAQIRYGYVGLGYVQFGLVVILACIFAAITIGYISEFLRGGKNKQPSVVAQVIGAKASKICLKVDIK